MLEALGKPSSHVPFMMPERIGRAFNGEPIREPVGSGPFRFATAEWRPGDQVVYERHDEYVPRGEPASGTAGGKRVYVDRVIWRYIPDPATAAAALESGEVDVWEAPPVDHAARLARNPSLALFVAGSRAWQGWLRPNCLQPPFDRKAARQALLYLVDQELYLQAAVGLPEYYRTCLSLYPCGTPYATATGSVTPDRERARALFRAAAYDGRPVVLLDPVDIPSFHAAMLVTRQILAEAGIAVDLQSMDWSTMASRRERRDGAGRGGWNLFPAGWNTADVLTPAVHAGLTGAGGAGYYGWHASEAMARLRLAWVRTSDPAARQRLAEQLQVTAYDEVPYVSWGEWVSPSVHRRGVRGLLASPAMVLWNVWLDQ